MTESAYLGTNVAGDTMGQGSRSRALSVGLLTPPQQVYWVPQPRGSHYRRGKEHTTRAPPTASQLLPRLPLPLRRPPCRPLPISLTLRLGSSPPISLELALSVAAAHVAKTSCRSQSHPAWHTGPLAPAWNPFSLRFQHTDSPSANLSDSVLPETPLALFHVCLRRDCLGPLP